MVSLRLRMTTAGVISRGTRGNIVPVVEKLSERMGTAFSSLKCLKRIMDGTANHFPAQNTLDCRIFLIHCTAEKKFYGGDTL